MRYTSVKEVRLYNGWHPIEVRRQQLVRTGPNIYRTQHRPLVDADYDGTVMDDVKVYLDGEPVEPSTIDPDEGVVELATPPAEDVRVEADYCWHPVGDGEIENAVEAAEAEVEALTGAVYTPHTRVERLRVFRGRHITLSEPVVSVQWVKVFDRSGNLLDASAEAEVVEPSTGLVRMKHHAAEPGPPWYLTPVYEVEVCYVAATARSRRLSGMQSLRSPPTSSSAGFREASPSHRITGLSSPASRLTSWVRGWLSCRRRWRGLGVYCLGGLEGLEAVDGGC
jgi:hypothetical protein